jgi:hypothetical protein
VEARHGGRKQPFNVREVFNGFSTCSGRDASGPQGPAAQEHGALAILTSGGRHVGAYPSRTVRRCAPARRPNTQDDAGCSGHAQRCAKQNGSSRRLMAPLHRPAASVRAVQSDTSGIEAIPEVSAYIKTEVNHEVTPSARIARRVTRVTP